MTDKEYIVARIIQLIQDHEGEPDSEQLVDTDPVTFKNARRVFGSWEDALVASLVHACKGSRKHKVTSDAVAAEEHHERTKMEGWDAQLVIYASDESFFTMSAAELEVCVEGEVRPEPFAPRGEVISIRCAIANPNQDALMVLSQDGVMYPVDSRVVPHVSTAARSPADVVGMASGGSISAILTRGSVRRGSRFVHATSGGRIKASSARDFGRVLQRDGVQALLLAEGDGVCSAFAQGPGHTAAFCANASGNGIRFKLDDVRTMGLRAQGVKSMALEDFDAIAGVVPVKDDGQILVISALGKGKRVPLSQFRIQGRAGQGMILMRSEDRGDELVALAAPGSLDEDLLVWTVGGRVARVAVGAFPLLDRAARGAEIIALPEGDRIAGVCRLPGAG